MRHHDDGLSAARSACIAKARQRIIRVFRERLIVAANHAAPAFNALFTVPP
jgi:hypothetical protein